MLRRRLQLCVLFLLLGSPLPAVGQVSDPVAPATPEPSAAAAIATTNPVTVKVYAKGYGIPVARAEVKVGETKLYTDKTGQVSVSVPATGVGDVEIYKSSFETLKIPFAELRGQTSREIYLYPATPQDNEVTIRGAKRPETSRKTISIAEATKVAPGGDPAQIPKLLPGVQSSSFSPEIVVRGSGPGDSRYQIDDWEVPFIFHRIGNISIIPDQLLSDVEFSTGGFGAQYGGATGGVVTLRTKSDVPERAKTELRVNVPLLSSVYHERPIDDGKAGLAVSVRRSYLEAFLPLVLPKDAGLTVVPYFGDAHAYYIRPTEDGYIKILGLYAYDGLKLLFPSDLAQDDNGSAEFKLYDGVQLLGMEWRRNLNADWSMTVSPRVTNIQSNIDIIGNRIHIGSTAVALHGEVTRRLGGKDKLYLGALASYATARADILAPKPDFSDPFFDFEEAPRVQTRVNSDFTDVAAWAAMDKELGDLMVTPGVRTFYSSQIKKSGADPRVNGRYKLNKDNALKAAVGQYSQTPEFRDTSKSFGNPDLNFIRSYHYVLGIETNWTDRWTTDFQTFYKETHDLVRSDPETNTNNDGSLISSGFEAFIRRNLTERLFGWVSYTYSKNRERDSDSETFRNSQYDQTHILNLAGSYKQTAQWETGGRLIFHTGDTVTPVDDAVYNANLDKYQQRSDPAARLYSERLPNYHELDIYENKDFLYDTWKMSLRFGLEFLAIEPQAQGVQYNYDYSEKEYFRGVPPIPYIEVRAVL